MDVGSPQLYLKNKFPKVTLIFEGGSFDHFAAQISTSKMGCAALAALLEMRFKQCNETALVREETCYLRKMLP